MPHFRYLNHPSISTQLLNMVRSARSPSLIPAQQNHQTAPIEEAISPAPVLLQPRFSLCSLAAIHSSSFALGFSNAERQAAARAILRHNAHIDGTHYHTRKRGGLHPSHIAFNSYTSVDEPTITQEAFADAALQDVFDAVSFFFSF
jgi:hypothetical protein